MSTNRNVANLSIAFVKTLVKMAGFGFAADMIDGAQECLNLLADIKNDALNNPNAEMIRTLKGAINSELNTIQDTLQQDGLSRKQIKNAVAQLSDTAGQTIKSLTEDDDALIRAVQQPEYFIEHLKSHAVPLPDDSSAGMQAHYEKLLDQIALEFLTLAPWSANFEHVALMNLLRCFPALTNQIARFEQNMHDRFDSVDGAVRKVDGAVRKVDENAAAHHQDLKNGQQKIESHIKSLETAINNIHTIRHNKQPNNTVWGSRPGPLKYWIERNPTCDSMPLHDAIFGSHASDEATFCVLIGPAGSGKTRLAASIAKRCEDAEWTLIAWIDAESKDMIKNQVIAISEEKFGLQLKPNEYPEVQFNRALSALPSQNSEKILIVLDNVENSASIDELLPKTPNIHVIVTTRHGRNWSHQHGWLPFKLSTFSRQESIQLLTQATEDDDKATANQIAQLLGDLPLAIGRAANTCTWLNINRLKQYFAMLQQYQTEKLLDSTVATRDNAGVISALQIAGVSALERIIDPDIRENAENILSALCYLSEYGVPVHWLKDESNLFSMCAYTELIDSSLIDETTDGTTVSIHRLQAHAMRIYWTPDVRDKAAETVSMILTRQLMQISADNSHERAKKAKRQLIEQISTMSKQPHSHFIFKYSEVQEAIFTLLKDPLNLELYYESLTLYEAVVLVAKLSESDCKAQSQLFDSNNSGHERLHRIIHQFEQTIISAYFSWTFTESELIGPQFALAKAHEAAGHLDEAITHYAKLVNTCAAIDGPTAPFTMKLRENLEAARRELERQEEDSATE